MNENEKKGLGKRKLFLILTSIVLVAVILFVGFSIYNNYQTTKGNKYTISFVANGGSETKSFTVNANGTITKPKDPTKENYVFVGWYYNDEPYDFTTPVTEDVKLEAKWEVENKVTGVKLNKSTIILYVGNTSKLTATVMPKNATNKNIFWKSSKPNIVSVDENGNIKALKEGNATITVTTEDGKFTAKVDVLARQAVIQGSIVESNNYQESKYTVKFKDSNGTTLAKSQTIAYGKTATQPDSPTKEGHTFLGWYNGKTKYSFDSKVKANLTLTAKWSKNKYTVTFVNHDGSVLQSKAFEYGSIPSYNKSVPTKVSTEQYEYTFSGWDKELATVTENVTYTATFTESIRKFTISFVDTDGSILAETQTITYKNLAVKPNAPAKAGHVFLGWCNGDVEYDFNTPVDSDITLTAKWYVNKHTITFVNYDGTVLETKSVDYGTTPVYSKDYPIREANNTYAYYFKGWDKEITPVVCDTTYTAVFTEKFIEYTITFLNEDGTVVAEQIYHYGDTIKAPANPSKESTAQYTYVFEGWSPALEIVSKNATYIAKYTETLRNYKVSFVDTDGSALADTQTIVYNNKVVKPADPIKEGHTFLGWYNKDTQYTFEEAVDSDITLTAKWSINKYTITFVNYDGSVLETKSVEYGATPKYTGKEPTKASNGQYTYVFNGWSPAIEAAKKDAKYTATFTETIKSYKVNFVDTDGATLAADQTIAHNNKVVKPADPIKEGHTFLGWYNKDTQYTFEEAVDSDITLTAKWSINKYTITFVNYDGSVLETKSVEYGATPKYTGKEPTKAANEQHTYVFNGWSPAIEVAKKDAKYTATFTETSKSYKVNFVDTDGSTLANTQTIAYNNKATKPTTPKKEGHTFLGWYNGNKEYTFKETVNSDITLTAKWSINKYTVKFVNYDGTVLETKSVEYGTTPKYTGKTPVKAQTKQYDYTFKGWSPELSAVKKDITYTATFTETLKSYTVKFVDTDGSTLAKTQTVKYGEKAVTPTAPIKAGQTFLGWYNGNKEYTFKETVNSDITLTAKWSAKKYTIKFVNDDGTVLETKSVEYGATPKYTGKTPEKEPSRFNTYVFVGWSPNITPATSDATYTAQFKYYFDVDNNIRIAVAASSTKQFKVVKDGKTLNVIFTPSGFRKPPYAFTDIFLDVANFLNRIASGTIYSSVTAYYAKHGDKTGRTIDLKDYDLTDTRLSSWYGTGENSPVSRWIGYVAVGEYSTQAAVDADSNDLIGKVVKITLHLHEDYATDNGAKTAEFNLTFSNQ